MRPRCFAHAVVTDVSLAAWVITVYLMLVPPGPNEPLRLPFFAALGVAVSFGSLALFPWVMKGFVKDVVLAYVAGYHQRASEEEQQRPALTVVR